MSPASARSCAGSAFHDRKLGLCIPAPTQRSKRPGLKNGLPAALAQVAAAHPGKRVLLFFQDEARIGQKGRICHRWWLRGLRPRGQVDQRYTFAYIFAVVEPVTGRDFCLVLPIASTKAMSEFLQRFAETLAEDEHVLMVLDGAGWHTSNELTLPGNITPLRLPPYSPELNPIERVWLYLRERYLSHRLFDDYEAILDKVCTAWRQITPERLRSLCAYPFIRQVIG
jgi:transposase